MNTIYRYVCIYMYYDQMEFVIKSNVPPNARICEIPQLVATNHFQDCFSSLYHKQLNNYLIISKQVYENCYYSMYF